MICGRTSFKIPIFGAIQQLKPPLRNEFKIADLTQTLLDDGFFSPNM
jgi:dTDP-glucose pyrophosphorylase